MLSKHFQEVLIEGKAFKPFMCHVPGKPLEMMTHLDCIKEQLDVLVKAEADRHTGIKELIEKILAFIGAASGLAGFYAIWRTERIKREQDKTTEKQEIMLKELDASQKN
jgi:hypothetical protein